MKQGQYLAFGTAAAASREVWMCSWTEIKRAERLENERPAESMQTGSRVIMCTGAKLGKEFEIVLCTEILLFSKNNSIYFNIFKCNSIGKGSSFDCE